MELILQQELPHQQKAIDAVCAALDGVQINPPTLFYENPRIVLNDSRIGENIRSLWSAVPAEYRNSAPVIGNYLHAVSVPHVIHHKHRELPRACSK